MEKEKKKKYVSRLVDFLCLLYGATVYAVGYKTLIDPLSLILGGATGVSTVLAFLWRIPTGLGIFLVNVPLLVIGGVLFGIPAMLRTVIGVGATSLLLDFFAVEPIPSPPLFGAVFGGALTGIGVGVMLFRGYTTGGSELAAELLLRRGRGRFWTIGRLVFLIDTLIVLTASILLQKTDFLIYSVLLNFCFSVSLDAVFSKERKASH